MHKREITGKYLEKTSLLSFVNGLLPTLVVSRIISCMKLRFSLFLLNIFTHSEENFTLISNLVISDDQN